MCCTEFYGKMSHICIVQDSAGLSHISALYSNVEYSGTPLYCTVHSHTFGVIQQCTVNCWTIALHSLRSVRWNISVSWNNEWFMVNYTLSMKEIPRAKPEGYLKGSGYISSYMMTWLIIQTLSFEKQKKYTFTNVLPRRAIMEELILCFALEAGALFSHITQ